jgi:hypothetical protein
MRNKPYIPAGTRIGLLLCAALAASCGDADSPLPDGTSATPTEIRFAPAIKEASGQPSARAILTGTFFPNYINSIGNAEVNGRYGLFICRNGSATFESSMVRSNNMQATASNSTDLSTTWDYSYEGLQATFKKIYIHDKYPADFYAYSPWIAGIQRPDQIPYNFGNQYDLMYAEENDGNNANKNVTADGILKTVTFNFRHALAALCFKLKLKHSQSNVILTKIDLRKTAVAGSNTHLYSAGTFNAIDGTINSTTDANALTNDFPDITFSTNTNNFIDSYTLVAPTEDIDDKGIEVQFYINNVTEARTMTLTIERNHTEYNDGSTTHYGFRAGKIYTFEITVDNFLKLDKVTVSDSWIVEEQKDILI